MRLPEGNLNYVWRVPGHDQSVIVKYAPPHIATDPDTPLDPSRLRIEARCLSALGSGGPLNTLIDESLRPPEVINVDPDVPVLVMEDIGDVPSLHRWLWEADPEELSKTSEYGLKLGRFIGGLHAKTRDEADYAEAFDNRSMQETRLAVQYQGVADMLSRAGVTDAGVLGEKAESLGEALLDPGRCLTMGDLWPPSVLVGGGRLRLIDWELAHYGRPLQDVAHWLAHLWMMAHRAPSATVAGGVEDLHASFVEGYRESLDEAQGSLWTPQEERDAAIHFGAEILVRTVGPFQAHYLYAGLEPDHAAVQEAVTRAASSIRDPRRTDLFAL